MICFRSNSLSDKQTLTKIPGISLIDKNIQKSNSGDDGSDHFNNDDRVILGMKLGMIMIMTIVVDGGDDEKFGDDGSTNDYSDDNDDDGDTNDHDDNNDGGKC